MINLTETFKDDFDITEYIPEGWKSTFHAMCERLNHYIADCGYDLQEVNFLQIKEKFGEMRVYADYGNLPGPVADFCQQIVRSYCDKTLRICCECGAENAHIVDHFGYILPFCDDCMPKEGKRVDDQL